MRDLYMTVIVVLACIVVLFKVQNFDNATVTLLSLTVAMPVSVLLFAVYATGMVTGGALLASIRRAVRGAKAQPE